MNNRFLSLQTIISLCLFCAIVFTVDGQSNAPLYAKQLGDSITKLNKNYLLQLEDLGIWRDLEKKYNDSVEMLKTLKEEVSQRERELGTRKDRQSGIHKAMAILHITNTKERSFDDMYKLYDTLTLKRMQGLGDKKTEETMNALLVCHRAEAVLSNRYDINKVNKARAELAEVLKKTNSGIAKDISNRLNQYSMMTDSLKTLLTDVNNGRVKTINPDRSATVFNVQVTSAFKNIEGRLNPKLLSIPSAYPYLTKVLLKAMNAIKEEPCQDIQDIINEL